MHFDLARHQVALVRLVAQNRSQPVQFIKDTIQLVKWALVDNKGSVVRAKGNSDKLIKPLQIHILNFNLNLIKIKPLNQIHSDLTGNYFKVIGFSSRSGLGLGQFWSMDLWVNLSTRINPGDDSDCFLENSSIFSQALNERCMDEFCRDRSSLCPGKLAMTLDGPTSRVGQGNGRFWSIDPWLNLLTTRDHKNGHIRRKNHLGG